MRPRKKYKSNARWWTYDDLLRLLNSVYPTVEERAKLFFRIHDTAGWYSLVEGVAADPAPEYTVQHSALGSGIFDFGVVAVNAESAESSMHVSLQTTAEPETGWYLVWGD